MRAEPRGWTDIQAKNLKNLRLDDRINFRAADLKERIQRQLILNGDIIENESHFCRIAIIRYLKELESYEKEKKV